MQSGIHVLCVDDDPELRESTATGLEQRTDGLDVTTARNGRDALAVFDGASDRTGRAIDCVVSDYELPDMDGLELFAAIRERAPTVPFVLFTGTGSEDIASEAISAGVTDYLRKGSSPDQYTVLANRIEDAVETRRADRPRRESDRELEQYRTLVETVDDPMYVVDDDGCFRVANEAFCALLDADRDRVLGEHVSEFVDRQSLERGAKTVRQLYSGERESGALECTVETDAGERRTYEANVSVLTDETGGFLGSTGVVRDVTSRARRERELARYEWLIELAPTALFVLDDDATINWCNDVFADAFVEERAALIGTPFPDLVDRGYYDEGVTIKYTEEVRDLLSSTTDRERARYQVRFQSPAGEERVHDVHTRLLPLEDGEFAGTIHAIRDVTRRQDYRRELERQNERLEEFASLVSHDLRNPLNVAQGHLELLEGAVESQHVDELRWSLSRMEELVDGLLRLARKGKAIGDEKRFSLASTARAAWTTVDTGDARLEIDADTHLYGDEARVRALLENLFRNAIEHGAADTDRLVVTVGPLERDRQSDGSGDRRDGFYVEDTGPGLPADDESLFEFGYTTASEGTGFGLAIVEGIAEAHGWTVAARDGDDGGARFEVRDVTVPADETTSP